MTFYTFALVALTTAAAVYAKEKSINESLLRYPIHTDNFVPSSIKELHVLEKRSPRRTVIVITKQKRRFQIIKCCGMVRCSKAGKNSTRFLKTTKSNQKPPKPKITAPGGGTFPPGKEPADPSNPMDPTNPLDPSNPADPSNPSNPIDPSNPITDPSNPDDPSKADPLNPARSDPSSTAGPNSATLVGSDPSNSAGSDPNAPGAGSNVTPGPGSTRLPGVSNPLPPAPGETTVVRGTPGATTGIPGATTGIPGATTGAPGATTGIPGATTRAPGGTTAASDAGITTAGPGNTNATTLPSGQTPPTTTPPRPPCFESKSNYTLSADKQTWANARLECQKKEMDLVNMETTEENTCVKFIIENAKQTAIPFWQALNKIGLPSYSQWLSGQSLTYTDWNSGAPAKIDTEDCSLISGGKWIGASCTDTYNYVCETPQPYDMCTNEQPVEISSTKLSFDDARAECQKKKMDLVSLETRDQNICFQRQLTMLGLAREPVYIGLTMTGNANYTSWVNAKPLIYLDWAAGNPAQFGTEKCVHASNFHWFDVSCTEPLRYACEDAVVLDPCFSMNTKHVLSNDTATWAQARLNCKKLGMELTSLETPQENICVMSILKNAGLTAADRVWHSLNMFGQPNFDSWNNGEPLTYVGWSPGNPFEFPWQSCGAFEYGKWGDIPCDWKLRYVCESAQIDRCDPDQFVASTSVLTFDAAVTECKKNGMALSVPETREENICIQRLLDEKGLTYNYVWNGLNRKGASNYTKWYNEAPLTYLDWNRGEPAQFPHEQCGIHFYAHWYDLPCEGSAYYVCEKAIVIDPCKGLPSTYKVSTDTKTWGGARAECKKQGGDLVSIDSAKEHACVKDKIDLAGKTTSIVFHGLNKMGRNNYTSLYSGSPPTATYWKSGEPAQFTTEHCSAYKDGAWMDVDCKGSNAYVCESPAPIDVCSKYSFSVSTEGRVYDDARFECLKKNMTIVDLDNPTKSMCLQQYIAQLELSSTPLSIGLDKRRTLNHTKWSNGQLLTFTDWDVNNPEAFASEHCAVALNHHWHDSPCGTAYRYVCEDDYKDPCADFSTYTIVTNNNKNWIYASEECKKLGGDLVSMETPEENFCVRFKIYLAGKKDERMWHSLSKLGTVYFIQWANGEPLTYSDFDPSYNLKSWTGEHCGGFESGIWGDIPCTWEIPYVCESNPSPKEICTDGQFEVFAEQVDYATSKLRCKLKGTAIANMETVTENICVQRAILKKGVYDNWVYTGLHKIGQTNYTKWENGAPLTYRSFPPGEPSAFASEDCMLNIQGQWYDIPCAVGNYYVCEKVVIVDPCQGLASTYTISTDTQTWGAARAACKLKSADLATVQTDKDHACIKDKIAMAGKSASIVFIGLNKIGQGNYLQWFDGTSISFTAWKAGEPAQLKTENCGAYLYAYFSQSCPMKQQVHRNDEWIDTPCMGSNIYVCESPAKQDVCAKYKFSLSSDTRIFDDAKFECNMKNGSLVSAETPEENLCLGQYLAEMGFGVTQHWIGMDKRGLSNYSQWLSGSALTYSDWDVNNPEAFATEDCVVFLNQHWVDSPCGSSWRYVCESNDFKHPCDGFSSYTISTTTKKWIDAKDDCKNNNGDLATLETPQENYCVQYLIYAAGKKGAQLWHSLNKMGSMYFQYWANGVPLNYSAFAPSYNLKSWTGAHCAAFQNSMWVEIACTASISYVCESMPAPTDTCKTGQFEAFPDAVAYDTANQKCFDKGMVLASAETVQENFCVQWAIMRKGIEAHWVYTGLNKRGQSNYTKWESNATLDYVGWAPNEPAAFASEDCMINIDGHWYDVGCGHPCYYVCEKSV